MPAVIARGNQNSVTACEAGVAAGLITRVSFEGAVVRPRESTVRFAVDVAELQGVLPIRFGLCSRSQLVTADGKTTYVATTVRFSVPFAIAPRV